MFLLYFSNEFYIFNDAVDIILKWFNIFKNIFIYIKCHGVLYQLPETKDWGVCAARDTSVYENMHLSTTKDPYRESSRRRETTQKELMHKNQIKR